MTPTQEQVIAWAREAGFDPHDMSDDFTCNLMDIKRFVALAYEAGRKDGREEYIAVLGQIIGEQAQGENNE